MAILICWLLIVTHLQVSCKRVCSNVWVCFLAILVGCCGRSLGAEYHVHPGGANPDGFIRGAKPGDVIFLHPGVYEGGRWIRNVSGTYDAPIRIAAFDPNDPPIISGGSAGWQFSACSHLLIEDIVFEKQSENGLNIDDYELYRKGNLNAATNIVLNRVTVRNLQAIDNNDGMKLSGVRNFRIYECKLEKWGAMGCGIDMVGCYDGTIENTLVDGLGYGGWGIQAKGGSSRIKIEGCQILGVTERGLQVGGGTSQDSFREKAVTWEAKDIEVTGCDILGANASISIVHALEVKIKNCRMMYPGRWFLRFLAENSMSGFGPSQQVEIVENLCVSNSATFIGTINSSYPLKSADVRLRGNIWFNELNRRNDLREGLPFPEEGGISGLAIPASFLNTNIFFTKLSYNQLIFLLEDERAGQVSSFYLQLFGCIACASLLLIGLCVVDIMVRARSMQLGMKRSAGDVGAQSFILGMFALVLMGGYLSHPWTMPTEKVSEQRQDAESLGSEKSMVPTGDRFEKIVWGFILVLGIFMLGCAIWVNIKNVSVWLMVCISYGLFTAMVIHSADHWIRMRTLGIVSEFGELSVNLFVGFFAGILLYGFVRTARYFLLLMSERFRRFDVFDGLLWLMVLGPVLFGACTIPLNLRAEFIYNKSRSFPINFFPFSGVFHAGTLADVFLVTLPLTWALLRLTNGTLLESFRVMIIANAILVVWEFTRFLRSGEYIEIDKIAMGTAVVLVAMSIHWFSRCSILSDENTSNRLPRVRLPVSGGLVVVMPWVILAVLKFRFFS